MSTYDPLADIRRLKLALIECRKENEHLKYVVQEMTTPTPDWNEKLAKHGVGLNVKETRMVALLTKTRGKVVSYSAIHNAVTWDSKGDKAAYNLVSVYLCRIRKKMKAAGVPARINTVNKRGLMWVDHLNGAPK